MPLLRRLVQALPAPYRTWSNHGCTKHSPVIQFHLRTWTGFPFILRSKSTLSQAPDASAEVPVRNKGQDEIIFAVNQPADLPDRVSTLFPTWQLCMSRKGVIRHFTFGSFAKAWSFMSLVADECKVKKHHPSWSNMYNQVTIEWTTHKPEGLSIKDVEMAEFCNRVADEIGLKK